MNRREQIIEILKKGFASDSTKSYVNIANEILALPLDLPSDEEIVRQAHKDYPYYDIGWNDTTMKRQLWLECAKWMRDEIIKRNK